MSAEIWLRLQKAVLETRPDLISEFDKCRDKFSITAFLNKHFPLDGQVENADWKDQLMLKAPDILAERMKRGE